MPGSFSSAHRRGCRSRAAGRAGRELVPAVRRRRPAADEDEVVGAASGLERRGRDPARSCRTAVGFLDRRGATPVDRTTGATPAAPLTVTAISPSGAVSTRYQLVASTRPQRETCGSSRSTVASAVVPGRAEGNDGIGAASARLSFGGGAATAVPGTASSRNASAAGMRVTGLLVVVTRRCPVPLTGD